MKEDTKTYSGASMRAHHIDARRFRDAFSLVVTDRDGSTRAVTAADVLALDAMYVDDLASALVEHSAAELELEWATLGGTEDFIREARERLRLAHESLPWQAQEH